MNIQDNCLNIPEKPTERNFGLLLSKKYRAKIAERYNNFFYKKFFKKIPNKYVFKFDAYSDLAIIQYALSCLKGGEIKARPDLPIENIYKLKENVDSQLSEYRKLTLNSWVSTTEMADCLGVTEKQLLEWRKQGYRPLDSKRNKKLALREGMPWR